MSRSRQVNRKGEKPASSPTLDAELRWRKTAANRPPDPERDLPPISTLPGPKARELEGQLKLA